MTIRRLITASDERAAELTWDTQLTDSAKCAQDMKLAI